MIYLKIVIFSHFHLKYIVSLLYFVITNCDQYKFNSEIHGKNTRQIKNFHQLISNLSLYQTGILNRGIKIYNNLPPFLKRTSYNSKEFKSLLRNFLYSNPFYTLDEHVNHNATAWWLYKYLWHNLVIIYTHTHLYCNYNILLAMLYMTTYTILLQSWQFLCPMVYKLSVDFMKVNEDDDDDDDDVWVHISYILYVCDRHAKLF
jgi:hypothetical protein